MVATDHDPAALGLRSRYASPEVLPDPIAEPDSFVDELLGLGRRLGDRPVLFATHDDALAAIGPREEEIDAQFCRPWSPWETLGPILDKSHQHAVARSIGFPIPETFEPEGASELEQTNKSLILETIAGIQEGMNPKVLEQMLGTYLPPKKRPEPA